MPIHFVVESLTCLQSNSGWNSVNSISITCGRPWTQLPPLWSKPISYLLFHVSVKELHREFLRAGSDVMQTFTFYASDDKLGNRGNKAAEIGVQFVYLYVKLVNFRGGHWAVILLQIVIVSPSLKKCLKLKMLQSLCNQTVYLKTYCITVYWH